MEANETALKQTHKLVNKNLQFLAVTNKTLVSSCAVRCVYVYCDVWNSHENEELGFFLSEVNNLFDMFAIQSCRKNCENTVGDLPRRISH